MPSGAAEAVTAQTRGNECSGGKKRDFQLSGSLNPALLSGQGRAISFPSALS